MRLETGHLDRRALATLGDLGYNVYVPPRQDREASIIAGLEAWKNGCLCEGDNVSMQGQDS